MDPASIITEVYKVGGIVLVLLVVMCIAAINVWRFFLRLIKDLSDRLDTVQNERARAFVNHIAKSSDAMANFAQENIQQTRTLAAVERSMLAVVNALGARRCLVETDRYEKRPTLPAMEVPVAFPVPHKPRQ
jgi:hypothetical protein